MAVALCHALIAFALVAGLGLEPARHEDDPLRVFETRPDPPPPPAPEVIPAQVKVEAPEGEAAPPNLKSVATPVVAPEPKVKLPDPPRMAAAPVPGQGAERSAGAAPVPGPGTGAGGTGTGTGSGGSGSGAGSGVPGPPVRRARQIAGELSLRDYPSDLRRAGIGGAVGIHLTIGANGLVTRCQVVASSGAPKLDQTTCRLVMERYRYEPARDAQGRAVPDLVGDRHVWWAGRRRN